ncbi:hypothetical protein PPL_08410 [Heterostelium album PN500]|uniref:DM14 domain-containing protein n=1 Tax=Heterostelium pallidum (strain ATCC 26659 / Pp 5 / PN500) TaxID=670386 RepID=D3BI42_HETP5|nr:hypothetical protein PPL_08410 [Heterostelium album PN500]EFA78942.1 hypothetical protein PPL_08410 [Heterostelium album PN500]|eukprot:XP_020431066.1 hypothetical protein PPL_08410 [Heterostelium album PN500]
MFGNKNKSKKNEADPFSKIEADLNSGITDALQEVDMGQIDKMMKNDIKDDDIQLTDADMDDPELLAQLTTIESGSKLEKPKPPPKPVASTTTTTATIQQTTTTKSVVPPKKKQLTEEEQEELMLKRELGEVDDDDDDNQDDSNDFQALIPVLENRLSIYKQNALQSKRADDIESAKLFVSGYKKIEAALSELNNGIPIDVRSLPPEVKLLAPSAAAAAPSKPVATSPTNTSPTSRPLPVQQQPKLQPKVEIMSKEKIELEERNQTWELFEEEFQKKLLFLQSEALKYREIDKHKAIIFLKESKGIHAIIDQIVINKNQGLSPPPFHFENKEIQNEVINQDIKENEMVITIGKYEFPKSFGNIDSYAQMDFPYPSTDEPTKLTTGSSNSVTSKDYAFKTTITMEKKKTFLRVAEKKKVQLSIVSSKMFFMKSVVGKCEIKLAPLMTQCQIIEKAPIMKEGTKKELGGYVEISIRLRTPLDSKQIQKKIERVLVLDGPLGETNTTTTTTTTTASTTTTTFVAPTLITSTPSTPSSTSVPSTPPPPTNTSPEITKPTTPSKPETSTPPPTQVAKPAPVPTQKPPASTPPTPVQNEEEEEDDPESLDRIVSNDVMEALLESINKQLMAGSAQPELLDRKQAIELKLMILETQVSSGMLTIENYVKQLEEAILKDKILAKKLVGEGKKEKAMLVMQRVKTMTKELESATAAEE